ncbi:MAG: hypothetical protein CMJ46_01620 [Planctomyces sp.]|nr:hypothetical protein [Planctomyces sp.]
MINEWYYQRDGEEIGPVPFEQIKDLAQSGQLSPEDQIRDAVSGMLLPAKSIGGLFPATSTAGKTRTPASNRRRQARDSQAGPRANRKSRSPNLYGESGISKVAEEAMAEFDQRALQSRRLDDSTRNGHEERTRRRPAAASRAGSSTDAERYNAPSASTRQAAKGISDFADKIGDGDDGEEKFSVLAELKEHPVLVTILCICIAAGIFKYLPERDYGPSVYREFNQIMIEMDQLIALEATEEEWTLFFDQSRGEIEAQIEKLSMKEERSPVERQLITIGKQLYRQLDPLTVNDEQLEKVRGSLESVREQIE